MMMDNNIQMETIFWRIRTTIWFVWQTSKRWKKSLNRRKLVYDRFYQSTASKEKYLLLLILEKFFRSI
jgi:hypothetical protein